MAKGFQSYLTVEDRHHVLVVGHLKTFYPNVLWTHAQNEGKKSAFERYKTSIMGQRAGWPDITILHPKYSEVKKDPSGKEYRDLLYLGLLIELKAPEHDRVVKKGKDAGKIVKYKGKLSPEQAELLEKLNKAKYRAVCCFGAEEAIKEIDTYFNRSPILTMAKQNG